MLFVEDDERVRASLARELAKHVAVATVASLCEAEALLAEHWDMMVIDRALPDGDGYAFAKRVRARSSAISLVMYSGVDPDEIWTEAATRGIAVAAKPDGYALVLQMAQTCAEAASARAPRIDDQPAHGRLPSSMRASVTPQAIRRDSLGLAPGRVSVPQLVRVPEAVDAVVCLGTPRDFGARDRVRVEHVLQGNGAALEKVLSGTRSISALVIDDAATALTRGGVVDRIRRDRHAVPILVVERRADASALATRGIAALPWRCEGVDADWYARMFVAHALERSARDRAALDLQAIDWDLTACEAELVWLCSMIGPRRRVAQLFGRGEETFRTHLRAVRAKLGVQRFEEIGRLTRS